jgi:hypothetical protein
MASHARSALSPHPHFLAVRDSQQQTARARHPSAATPSCPHPHQSRDPPLRPPRQSPQFSRLERNMPLPPQWSRSFASTYVFQAATQFAPASVRSSTRFATRSAALVRSVPATPEPPWRCVPSASVQFVAELRAPPSVPLRRAYACPPRSYSPRHRNIFQNVFLNMFQNLIWSEPDQQAHACAPSQRASAASLPHRLRGRSARWQLLPKPARPP